MVFSGHHFESKKQKTKINFDLRLVIYVYCWTSIEYNCYFSISVPFLLVCETYLMIVLIDGNTLRRFYIVAQHFMTFYVGRPWNCVMQNVPVCDGYLMT